MGSFNLNIMFSSPYFPTVKSTEFTTVQPGNPSCCRYFAGLNNPESKTMIHLTYDMGRSIIVEACERYFWQPDMIKGSIKHTENRLPYVTSLENIHTASSWLNDPGSRNFREGEGEDE
ncbi:unnamed protein product [Linum trigynum]|uniref:Uncharacterized protein n=1 Tax=Linum trigynum TaxID=586398 RepID=A0AAV2EVD6_9ROSI